MIQLLLICFYFSTNLLYVISGTETRKTGFYMKNLKAKCEKRGGKKARPNVETKFLVQAVPTICYITVFELISSCFLFSPSKLENEMR